MNNYVNQMDWGHNPSEADRAYAKALGKPIPAISSPSDGKEVPTPQPPVLDPLNWKEWNDMVEYWKARALKAEQKLEDYSKVSNRGSW